MAVVLAKSSDDIEYSKQETPCEITLEDVVYSTEPLPDGYSVHHIYVKCSEIKRVFLPLDANPREPGKSSQVDAMTKTLYDFPKDFFKLNNGMTGLCKDVSFNESEKKCTVYFDKFEGICNGGHTYFAIVTSEIDEDCEAIVHLELLRLPEDMAIDKKKNEIVKIARARNNNNQLQLKSQADMLDYYRPFKGALRNSRYVIWHENDSNADQTAIQVDHYIRLLSALDPNRFYHPIFNKKGDSHKSAALAIKSINSKWFEETETFYNSESNGALPPLVHMAVFGDDIFALLDLISKTIKDGDLGDFRRTGMYQFVFRDKVKDLKTMFGETGCLIPPTWEVLFTGLFRTDIWKHLNKTGDLDLIGWYIDPYELWNLRANEVLNNLAKDMIDQDNDQKRFVRAQAPYDRYLYVLGTGQMAPPPSIIYDLRNGGKYLAITKPEQTPTHYLILNAPEGLQSLDLSPAPEGAIKYERLLIE